MAAFTVSVRGGGALRGAALGGLLACVLGSLAACSGADSDPDVGGQAGQSGSTGRGGSSGASGGRSSGTSGGSGAASAGGGSSPAGSADAQVYVDAHNAVRAAVMKPASYAGAWAPVPPVTWSDEIAASAQEWADHLRDELGCGLMHASGTGYGENLAAGTNLGAQRAVDLWASEVENYAYSPDYAFESDTGHYTQIVWRKTTQIGCGRAQCGGSAVVVCRYSPPGNYIGQPPY